jgi:hypothetical protein
VSGQQIDEQAPFFLAIRGEGAHINCWLMPRADLQEQLGPELGRPLLMGCMSRAVCDSNGGINGPLFRKFVELMKEAMVEMVRAVFGQSVEPVVSERPPGGGLNG